MRLCPRCYAAYPDAVERCPVDGTVLADARPAEARWAHAGEPADPPSADELSPGRAVASSDPLSGTSEPPGRPWTAEAALARGELSLAAVAQAAARAEAARAAAGVASPRARWPWITASLLLVLALGAAWWGRTRASETHLEASHRLPPVQAEGGVVSREAEPVRLDPAAPPAAARPEAPAMAEPLVASAREAPPAPEPAAPDAAYADAPPGTTARIAPPARVGPAGTEPARTEATQPAPVREATTGRVRAREAGFSAVVGTAQGEQWVAVRAAGGERRLAKTFTAATTLGGFSFEWLDDRPVIVFSAADARWTTHYAWDYDAGVLFWTAYDSQTRQTTLGPSVTPGSEIEERLRRPG